MEENLDSTDFLGSNPTTKSRINGHPRSANKKTVQASTTILVEAIPDSIDYAGTALCSEPRVFEGLTSMHFAQGPPRTATLEYSAAVYAEAMLYRSASSLREEYGMKLSLAPCRPVETIPSLPAAAERSIVTPQIAIPRTEASQPSTAAPSASLTQPPAWDGTLRVDERTNSARRSSGLIQTPSIRSHQLSTRASLAAHRTVSASSRLNNNNSANVLNSPARSTPYATPSALSPAATSINLRPTPANPSTMNTVLRPTPTNPTLDGNASAASSSNRATNPHSSSTQVNAPSKGKILASSPSITHTNHSSTGANTGTTLADTRSSLPLTKPQQRSLLTGIQRMSKRKVALLFAEPVSRNQVEMMGIPDYFDVITKPMDLRTMEEKLKNAQYRNIDEYVADFAQMVENTVRFNGPDHEVTREAYALRESFEYQVRQACQSFEPDAEQATPIPRNGRPRKYRKVDEEVMELVRARGDSTADSDDGNSDEAAYVPRSGNRRRQSSGRGLGQRGRRGISF